MLSRNVAMLALAPKELSLSTLLMLSRKAGKVAVNLPILPANFTSLAFHLTRIVAKTILTCFVTFHPTHVVAKFNQQRPKYGHRYFPPYSCCRESGNGVG
jgi:hypothetical protein